MGRRFAGMRRGFARFVASLVALALLLALGVWLVVHGRVATLRSLSATVPPVPPLVAHAILAAEDPYILRPPAFSLRAVLPTPPGTLACGPSPLAFVLVRSLTPSRRALLWHLDTAVTSYVVSRLFAPEELLRIYAHELYLGTVDGHDVRGVEAGSRVYFGKPSRDLTVGEAATLAGMIHSPNFYSPIRYPERAQRRRDRVLERVRHFGFRTARRSRS